MIEPGRSFTANNTSYRYGFNGKEKDPNITSEDYDYGARIYDARVVRFLSVDPIQKKYPELTPYQFASNRPIDGVDKDGLEWELSTVKHNLEQNVILQQQVQNNIQQKTNQQAQQAFSNQTVVKPADNSYAAQQRSNQFKTEYEKNKAYQGATMDPLAAGMIYPMANAVGQYTTGTINHGIGIYQGIKNGDGWETAKNTGLLALDVAPFVIKGTGSAATETFYRAMSESDFATFQKTNILPATSETFISPTAAYAGKYQGVLVEINTKPGTFKQLLGIGVSDPAHPMWINR